MANPRNKAWGPTQPSAAFLIKCAKEREKLRSTLQTQLQDHMLSLLQNQLFSDIQIRTNTKRHFADERNSSHSSFPELIQSHKCILKIRTPAFYKHLIENEDIQSCTPVYNSYLEEYELKEFLKKVYTDDDIRKYECESLRLSKKYCELLHQNKNLLNKHILEVDDFEKESNASDKFVTPQSTPISPESKLNVCDLFNAAQNSLNNNLESFTEANKSQNMKQIDEALLQSKPLCNGYSPPVSKKSADSRDSKDSNVYSLSLSDDVSKNENTESLIDYGDNSDQELEPEDFSNVGSMVRSNTFDLETQGSLEDAAMEDSIDWCSRPTSDSDFKTDTNESERDSVTSRRLEGAGFYLHDQTPSPKSNIFRHGFPKDSYANGYPVDYVSTGVHLRRFDGSMSDSGFMSHSTYSAISDSVLNGSVSSSLILSSEDMPSPSHITTGNGTEISVSKLENSKHLSGSMFPFYIDINSLPTSSTRNKEKKSGSPSHSYMYIDARNSKRSIKQRLPCLNTSYDEFFSELEAEDRYSLKDPLMKAQSTSHLEMCKSDYHEISEKLCPQSCYMYVDLDSVSTENVKSCTNAPPKKHEPSAVSMFINLDDTSENCMTSDLFPHKNTKVHLPEIRDLVSQVEENNQLYSGVKDSNCEPKRKNSDSLLSSKAGFYVTGFKSHSLTRHIESRSASADEYRARSGAQEVSLLGPKNVSPRLSHSAHRYSDGVFYEDLCQRNLGSNISAQIKGDLWNDSKSCQLKDLTGINHPFKFLHSLSKKEESSGSCSNLGELKDDGLLSDDRVKWKSTGDMSKSKSSGKDEKCNLLPMSPILRRKNPVKNEPKFVHLPVVKASTKPQDVDAMTFPKSLMENAVPKTQSEEIKCESSPFQKKIELIQDSKNSNESCKLIDVQPALMEPKNINNASLNKSHATPQSTTVGNTSDKHITHDVLKEKIAPSSLPLALSGECDDDSETIYSEVSDISSSLGSFGIASLERHWQESQNPHLEVSAKNLMQTCQMLEACSKLGEDLLKMFLDEVDTDIILEVEEKEIKAHRCILSSRCKYFANLLSTSNPDKNSSKISLEGFTFSAVHFALCHIYSGAINIPKDCNLSELTLLADMLGLVTLTDPCLQCTQGVVECLPLAVVCGLSELQEKCIWWLGKYFTRTWTNKSFAALSDDLRDLCYNVTAKNISVPSVIEMTMNCDRLITTLPQMKWTEPIFGMVTRLLQDCIHFMANYFDEILKSESFLALGKGQSWNVTSLEEDIISAVELTTPDIACKSYNAVNQLLMLANSSEHSEYCDFTQNFMDLLHKISRHCERYLIQNANKVVHCVSWSYLAPQVQKRIRDAAVIVFEFEKPTAPPPRLSSLQRKLKKQNENDMDCIERSTYPKKGKSIQRKAPKDVNLSRSQENSDSWDTQHQECENLLKKMVSPIKEEVLNNSSDTFDILNPYRSSSKSPLLNKVYVDAHEEDSLRDLQELPQDQSQCLDDRNHLICMSAEVEDSHSPAHCSDNPDSLETNDISSDSKDDTDALVSAEDAGMLEKGVIETPEVHNKNFDCTELKREDHSKFSSSGLNGPSLPKSFQKEKVPHLKPLVPHNNEKNIVKNRDRSPVKKLQQGKSLVPLPKSHNLDDKSLISLNKDLVAEIDADSKMVNHCLQEAEMLEQQLSRKLQRQHQDGSCNLTRYIQNSPVRGYSPNEFKSKSNGYKLQKASSTSQIKNLAGQPLRGKSPGRHAKSNASSPSVGHAPRIMRSSESKEKISPRKSSQSPKGSCSQRSFKSIDNIASVHKQLSVSSAQTPKRILSKSNRPRTVVTNSKSLLGHK